MNYKEKTLGELNKLQKKRIRQIISGCSGIDIYGVEDEIRLRQATDSELSQMYINGELNMHDFRLEQSRPERTEERFSNMCKKWGLLPDRAKEIESRANRIQEIFLLSKEDSWLICKIFYLEEGEQNYINIILKDEGI